MQDEARPLKVILDRSQVENFHAAFLENDETAIKKQGSYKHWYTVSILVTLFAGIVGSTFMLPLDDWFGKGAKWLVVVGQFILLAVSLFFVLVTQRRMVFQDWMVSRTKAENSRIEYFREIFRQEEPHKEGEIPSQLLKFEYFRKYFIEDQVRYFKKSARRHEENAGLSKRGFKLKLLFIAVWVIVAVIAACYAAIDFQLVYPFLPDITSVFKSDLAQSILLAFGVAISAYNAAVQTYSQMNMDVRNSVAYARVEKELNRLMNRRLAKARTDALNGNKADFEEFVEDAIELIAAEHLEWSILIKNREVRPVTPDSATIE